MAQIKATIDRFEGDKAVIIFDDGQELIIEKKQLDFQANEGEVIYLTLSLSQEETKNQESKAKEILKEILNQDDQTS